MAINFGEFEIDPETGEYRRVPKKPAKNPGKAKKPRKPVSKGNRILSSVIITLVFGFVYFYFELPAINFRSPDLYLFVILLCVVYCACEVLLGGFRGDSAKSYVDHVRRKITVPFYIICACIAVAIIGSVIGLKVFRARSYSEIMTISTGDFATEVAETAFDNIPMLDKDSANVLANRKLGELSDLVSQFEVYNDSFQINYKNKPVRVTYLRYGDFFKWFNNMSEGIPAYMVIDMVSQEVSVARLDEGIKYSPSEYFFRNIERYLRFKYPTKIFSEINFEIDEDGDPYWVATAVTKRVGLFGGTDAIGAVLVNAVTGESEYLTVEEMPSWVDRIYTAEIIIEQYDYYGIYKNGFINSMFGQRDCTETTDGYNYIAQGDDVWVYTGITSVSGDQGNVGFILVNQRTKEANYYPCAGAEEHSAEDSAEGAVQQFKYTATFPLLLNVDGEPTYFMALKDASQLVKMYAMVNVQQYQIVATGNSVTECAANYEAQLIQNNIIDEGHGIIQAETLSKAGRIGEIRSAVIGGNTLYFISLEGSDDFFSISAAADQNAVIMNVGDRIKIEYVPAESGSIHSAVAITLY